MTPASQIPYGGQLKRGTPNHPKVFDLCEELKIKRPTAIGYLELLWHFTATYAPDGDLGRFSHRRIEAAVDWTGASGRLVLALIKVGWLDQLGSISPSGTPQLGRNSLLVHDWQEHADQSVRKRLARSGKQFVEDTPKVTGQYPVSDRTHQSSMADSVQPHARAVPEPEPEPEPDTSIQSQKPEPEQTTAVAVNSWKAAQEAYFETFWEVVWARIGRGAAHTAFLKAATTPARAQGIIGAARAQGPLLRLHASSNGHSVLHPATWLNQRRWEDDIEDLRRDADHSAKIHPKDAASMAAVEKFLTRHS